MGFKRLTRTDKLRIEIMIRDHSVKEIAEVIGCHISTVYRELKRGAYLHTNSDLTVEQRYSADTSDLRYQKIIDMREYGLKIGNDHAFAQYIEDCIVKKRYSPAAALARIKLKGYTFKTQICLRTLYNYIDQGVFLKLTNKNLPMRGKRKRKYDKVTVNRAPAGESIEKRPQEIAERISFGHWEMDSVIGKKGSEKTLLVMTERLTRMEVIRLLPDHTSESVVRALDGIENSVPLFRRIFQTITCDNGTEFSDREGIEKEERTKTYYCHPYCSYERGSNENCNKLIRRHFPKGMDFDTLTEEKVKAVENWINAYPRKILGYRTADDLFREEIKKLG